MRSFSTILLAGLAVTVLVTGCYHDTTHRNYDQLVCDANGCLVCDDGTCFEYACDADSQCPQGYACTAAGHCALVSGSGIDPADSELECDATGCYECTATDTGRVCYAYECDDLNPCPEGRSCDLNGNCVVDQETCETECCANADCGDNQICTVEGVCVDLPGVSCDDEHACPDGQVCEEGACVAEPEPECDDESPCAEGLVCEEGVCVEPSLECEANEDCEAGERCQENACVAIEMPPRPEDSCVLASDCGLTGTCIDGDCHFACEADADCPVTQVCDEGLCLDQSVSPAECVTGADCATEGALCIDGTCRPTCAEDADCGAHERCDAARGLCEPDPQPLYQCLGNIDCAEAEDCVDGRCLLRCETGTECGARTDCALGYCTPQFECLEAADCAEGESCVNGLCSTL